MVIYAMMTAHMMTAPHDDAPHDEKSSEISGTQTDGAADELETVGDGEAAPEATPEAS
jgi:hypothetical protein